MPQGIVLVKFSYPKNTEKIRIILQDNVKMIFQKTQNILQNNFETNIQTISLNNLNPESDYIVEISAKVKNFEKWMNSYKKRFRTEQECNYIFKK